MKLVEIMGKYGLESPNKAIEFLVERSDRVTPSVTDRVTLSVSDFLKPIRGIKWYTLCSKCGFLRYFISEAGDIKTYFCPKCNMVFIEKHSNKT